MQGRHLDLYMWSCNEALAFGRKEVQVTVLRLGWNPNDSTPSLITTLFRRREINRARNLASPPAPTPDPPGSTAARTDQTTDGHTRRRRPAPAAAGNGQSPTTPAASR